MFLSENYPPQKPNLSLCTQQVKTFKRRQVIPLERSSLWQIEAGFARTVTSDEDGTLTTLGFWQTGDTIGLCFCEIRPYWVECLTSVKISRLLHTSPRSQEALMWEIQLSQTQQAQELLRITHCKRVETRLLKLLEWLGRSIGTQVESGYFIPLHLTHQDLADTVGSTRVTVTRLMNEFQRNGVIRDTPAGYFFTQKFSLKNQRLNPRKTHH